MRKSILILVIVGTFFAGTLLTPQYAAADHAADFDVVLNAFNILIDAVVAGFTNVVALIVATQADVDVNTQKSTDNMMDIQNNDADISGLQTQIDDLPNNLFSCDNGGLSCFVGVGVCANQGINVCIDDVAQCSATAGGPPTEEVCDSLDNDCDGTIDEDVTTTFFEDGDGDGFGNPANFVEACTQPDGFVTDNTDCDDVQATVNPGQMEICDGLDNDCDGSIDEGGVCILTETNCSDGIDNDGDLAIDCADFDCDAMSCDDGLFCNGVNTCQAGTCVASGDPCPGPDGDNNCQESCDEGGSTCTANDPDLSVCGISGEVCETGVCIACICGDGILACAEECDDGNTDDGDGCSAVCLLE